MEVDQTYIRALETAVLLNEAFESHSHLDIRLFAHSTTIDDKCIVWDYGTGMNARQSLSSYRPQNANFDDHAIHAVAATLSHLSDTRRIMVSISDGSPCVKLSTTVHYAGSGVHATKRSVEELRAMGWIVIGVEIGTHFAERIYGDRWLLKISDPSKLPDRIAEMTIKILRKALG
jgi:nitric oxide reductase activation protein